MRRSGFTLLPVRVAGFILLTLIVGYSFNHVRGKRIQKLTPTPSAAITTSMPTISTREPSPTIKQSLKPKDSLSPTPKIVFGNGTGTICGYARRESGCGGDTCKEVSMIDITADNTIVATTTTGQDGAFTVSVPFGQYTVKARRKLAPYFNGYVYVTVTHEGCTNAIVGMRSTLDSGMVSH